MNTAQCVGSFSWRWIFKLFYNFMIAAHALTNVSVCAPVCVHMCVCACVCVHVWVCPCRVARLCTWVENTKSATVVTSGGGLSKSGSLEGVCLFKGCWSHHSYLKYIAHNLKIHKSTLVLNWPRDNSFLALPCCLYLLKLPLKHWCLQEACTKETESLPCKVSKAIIKKRNS